MAQYSSCWVHGVAAHQEADVKQNESRHQAYWSLILWSRRHPILVFYVAQKDFKARAVTRRDSTSRYLPQTSYSVREQISFEYSSCRISIQASIDKVLVFDGLQTSSLRPECQGSLTGRDSMAYPIPRIIWKKGEPRCRQILQRRVEQGSN
jgi:hypothetical protein